MNVEAYAKKHDLGTLLELLSVELLSKRPQSPLSYLEELCRKVSAAKHAKGVSTAAIVSETLESVVAQIKGTEAATKEEKAATPRAISTPSGNDGEQSESRKTRKGDSDRVGTAPQASEASMNADDAPPSSFTQARRSTITLGAHGTASEAKKIKALDFIDLINEKIENYMPGTRLWCFTDLKQWLEKNEGKLFGSWAAAEPARASSAQK